MKQKVLSFAAVGEGAFGLLLLVDPPLIARWLLARDVSGTAITLGRLAGAGLIVLGVACWRRSDSRSAAYVMLTYSAVAIVLLIVLGISGVAGVLLWPGVVAHSVIVALLLWPTRGTKTNSG